MGEVVEDAENLADLGGGARLEGHAVVFLVVVCGYGWWDGSHGLFGLVCWVDVWAWVDGWVVCFCLIDSDHICPPNPSNPSIRSTHTPYLEKQGGPSFIMPRIVSDMWKCCGLKLRAHVRLSARSTWGVCWGGRGVDW